MTWPELDWSILDRLRSRFLGHPTANDSYWETPADLANYDFTYGERIAWKWDHVLRELHLRRWAPGQTMLQVLHGLAPAAAPPRVSVLDWGCGSGVASRRVIDFFGADQFESLTVWDHSPLACAFAADTAQNAFPSLRVAQATPGFLASTEPLGLLVVSHVLNELSADALASLRQIIARSHAVLWVEPGTHAISRQLGALRNEFLPTFHAVAPCTHAHACPILAADNERDWCHFFAPPPSEIFADSHWVKFGQRAGIDLRSLPYCFLALDRRPPATPPAGLSRVIGRVEHFKPYTRLLNCDANGLTSLELPKRADPALLKQLERTKAPLVYRWQREGHRILSGEPLAPPSAPEYSPGAAEI